MLCNAWHPNVDFVVVETLIASDLVVVLPVRMLGIHNYVVDSVIVIVVVLVV